MLDCPEQQNRPIRSTGILDCIVLYGSAPSFEFEPSLSLGFFDLQTLLLVRRHCIGLSRGVSASTLVSGACWICRHSLSLVSGPPRRAALGTDRDRQAMAALAIITFAGLQTKCVPSDMLKT